jgi:hypothetical protein
VLPFVYLDLDHLPLIIGAIALGSLGGVLGARRVQMTQMPQMVALFNGVGGGAAALVALLVTAASVGAAPDAKAPAPETIVKVTGNASEGFGIEHYDGSSTFPPTHSEAMAECQEYSAKVGRIRCRVEVKTWYRDLVATKRALKYAHRS